MALTLAEASKLSNDVLLAGVIETIIKDSPILQVLPFIEIVGNGLTYNRENAAPSAAFYDVGDEWSESTPTFTQVTATLKIVGGDADIDNFLLATRSNVQDLEAAIVQLKAKAVQQMFEDTFVNGDTDADAKSFDGIDKLCESGQSFSMGVNGAALTLAKLDELVDLVKGGKPDILLMSKRTRRGLNNLARTAGGFLEADRNEFGQMVRAYDLDITRETLGLESRPALLGVVLSGIVLGRGASNVHDFYANYIRPGQVEDAPVAKN